MKHCKTEVERLLRRAESIKKYKTKNRLTINKKARAYWSSYYKKHRMSVLLWCNLNNHKTKAVRGLLCDLCNRGLGMFRDSITNLINAADYLRKTNEEETK